MQQSDMDHRFNSLIDSDILAAPIKVKVCDALDKR